MVISYEPRWMLLIQEHVSGHSSCQNSQVGSVTRIPQDLKSNGILATNPMSNEFQCIYIVMNIDVLK